MIEGGKGNAQKVSSPLAGPGALCDFHGKSSARCGIFTEGRGAFSALDIAGTHLTSVGCGRRMSRPAIVSCPPQGCPPSGRLRPIVGRNHPRRGERNGFEKGGSTPQGPERGGAVRVRLGLPPPPFAVPPCSPCPAAGRFALCAPPPRGVPRTGPARRKARGGRPPGPQRAYISLGRGGHEENKFLTGGESGGNRKCFGRRRAGSHRVSRASKRARERERGISKKHSFDRV